MTAQQTIEHINALSRLNKQVHPLVYEMQQLSGKDGVDEVVLKCTITQVGGHTSVLTERVTGTASNLLAIIREDLASRTLADLFYHVLNS
jgi:hypothetical protein